MSHPSAVLALVLCVLLPLTLAQNVSITTESPTASPTMFFTTNAPYNGTFPPTLEPTLNPSGAPSVAPSPAPTIAIGAGQAQRYRVEITFRGADIDADWFDSALGDAALEIFIAACGLSEDEIEVAIGTVTTLYEEDSDSDTASASRRRRRRLLQEAAVGVSVEFLAALSDARDVNTFEAAFASGAFDAQFSAAVAANFGGVSVDAVTADALSDAGVGDGDAFLGAEEESLSEQLLSPYIFLGIVCSSVGVVWLLFLRSHIDRKPPSFLSEAVLQPAKSLEMVQNNSN